jgi:type VI secretion system protein VasG
VPYYPLGDAQIMGIVKLKLGRLADRIRVNHGALFTFDDAVVRTITERCTEVDSGARNVDYILTQSVLPELSSLVLERMALDLPFSAIRMVLDARGRFAYNFSADNRGASA